MMPFSAVRSLLLLVLSWAVLGLGITCAVDAYQRFRQGPRSFLSTMANPVDMDPNTQLADPNSAVREPTTQLNDSADERVAEAANEQSPTDQRIVVVRNRRSDWIPWAEVVAAVLCLGLSVGGRWPVKLLMKKSDRDYATEQAPASTFEILRPDGSKLYGEIRGNDESPTLIFTHGWSLNSSAWQYVNATLSHKFQVVTWDLAGLGKSRGPSNNNYRLEKFADDLRAILEHVAPSGPVILVGHSIGGMTLQTFCRVHGDTLGQAVKGLVLVHTTYTNPLSTNLLAWIAKPMQPLIMALNYLMIPLAPLFWLSNWQSYYNGSAHWAARWESFTGKQTWEQLDHSARMGAEAWPGVLARGNRAMIEFNEEPTLPTIDIPVLVISSPNDRLTVQSASQHIQALLPNDQSMTNTGGHLGYWEHNDEVSRAIASFADKTVATRALV